MSDSQEDPWAWMTPEKAKRLSTFGKLDGTMETAKDILEKKILENMKPIDNDRVFQDFWMLFDPAPSQSIILNAMKEIADKAWEAGFVFQQDMIDQKTGWYRMDKSTFMKSLFPETKPDSSESSFNKEIRN